MERRGCRERDAITIRSITGLSLKLALTLQAAFLRDLRIALYAYLSCWTIVGPAGIDERTPWGRRTHSLDQVTSLEIVSRALRRDDEHLIGNDGPWHKVEFVDGKVFDFGPENEKLFRGDISVIENFIAQQSGKTWRVRGGGVKH